MSRYGFALAVLLLLGLSPTAARAEVPLVGLFEGHGFAHPKDPEQARAIRAAVRRLRLSCRYFDNLGGSVVVDDKACSGAQERVSRYKGAAIAAMLDVLDEPQRDLFETYKMPVGLAVFRSVDDCSAILQPLTDTGEVKLVPVLIRALERATARAKHPDPRIARMSCLSVVDPALQRLTYANLNFMDAKEEWSAWYREHGSEPRAEWRRQTIQKAKAALKAEKEWRYLGAAEWLMQFPDTRGLARSVLVPLLQRPECRDPEACSRARSALTPSR